MHGEPIPFVATSGFAESLTLQYNAIAPKSGKLKVGTDVSGVQDGHLQTTVEVLPPK